MPGDLEKKFDPVILIQNQSLLTKKFERYGNLYFCRRGFNVESHQVRSQKQTKVYWHSAISSKSCLILLFPKFRGG